MAKRRWEYSLGMAEAFSLDPIAAYTVWEDRSGRRPKWHAYASTEAGPIGFGRVFRTQASAQHFCEADVDSWRRSQAAL